MSSHIYVLVSNTNEKERELYIEKDANFYFSQTNKIMLGIQKIIIIE